MAEVTVPGDGEFDGSEFQVDGLVRAMGIILPLNLDLGRVKILSKAVKPSDLSC